MVLDEAKEPLTTTQISELISKRSKGEIYKISATLRDSLEHRLKREGYVEGIEVNNKGLYSITPKGQKLSRMESLSNSILLIQNCIFLSIECIQLDPTYMLLQIVVVVT
jgi:DNA-binding PadR family transcriptional regulator